VEVEKNEIKKAEAIQNPAATAMGGAGIQAAQLIANKKKK
jgi:predicted Fe-Mo cluster-binding NifX family protein